MSNALLVSGIALSRRMSFIFPNSSRSVRTLLSPNLIQPLLRSEVTKTHQNSTSWKSDLIAS